MLSDTQTAEVAKLSKWLTQTRQVMLGSSNASTSLLELFICCQGGEQLDIAALVKRSGQPRTSIRRAVYELEHRGYARSWTTSDNRVLVEITPGGKEATRIFCTAIWGKMGSALAAVIQAQVPPMSIADEVVVSPPRKNPPDPV